METSRKMNKKDKCIIVLRKYFHGLTDEQFNEDINEWPLSNTIQAMIEIGEINYVNGVSDGIKYQCDMEEWNNGRSPKYPLHPVTKMRESKK